MARNLQEHILNTASNLFYSQGIKATGIDTIIKASGIAKMSLYKYFPSKEALILAHLQRSKELMQTAIRSGLEARADTAKAKLLAVFDVFEELLRDPGFRGCPFINASAEFAEEDNPIQQAAAEYSNGFSQFLVELAEQAGIAKPAELANQLAMLIAGAMVKEQVQKETGAMRSAHRAAQILIEFYASEAN
jgi:AcrR family transcriptional regulator